ncbi:hypothetical protein FDP22_20925 (plasmid) [Paroceanicella profunda]|uniref:Peptidase M48 domain-containing protein n=1 Tax=Paroceanicella profunda TaxID=2579971 RepID=A0A5B8G327_9RHOB|nr:M48 family metallopeptidase [Paroceanicella profunda]QDL94340.1 hypothetical protein FDP22_20925 [Paroceanicella profunda]
MFRRIAILSASAALAGCAQAPVNVFGTDVADMLAPVIRTAAIRHPGTGPNRMPPPAPPRTFSYSGRNTAPGTNYWLAEREKAPIEAASRVIYNPPLRSWLHELAGKLMAQAPEGAPPVQVHVLASSTYNAFALESGDIYVSINTLAQAASEDEVAIVLGHEIGHILLGHHDKEKVFAGQRDATGAALTGVATVGYLSGAARSGTLMSGGALQTGERRKLEENMLAVTAAKLAVDFVGNDVVNASWNRAQEGEADMFGLDLAIAAGYDPYEMYNSFAHLIEADQQRQTRLRGLEAQAEARNRAVEAEMSAALKQGRLDLDPLLKGAVSLLSDLGTAAAGDARDYVSAGYHDPVHRQDEAQAYLERFYPDVSQSSGTDYPAVQRRLKIVEINNAYALVDQALTEIMNGRFPEAHASVRAALRTGSIARDPLPRWVEALALEGMGDMRGALEALRKVNPEAPMSVQAHLEIAMLEARLGNDRAALAQLDRAQVTYGAGPVQPARVGLLMAMQRREEALRALENCETLGPPAAPECRRVAAAGGLTEPAATTGAPAGGSPLDDLRKGITDALSGLPL